TIRERGFIYKNGAIEKYAPNSFYTGGMTTGSDGVIIERKTSDFNKCWKYNENTNIMTFSTYINGFTEEKFDYDLIVRGYITFTDDNGISHTIYSDTINRSVNYVKAGGESNIDTNARTLVWSAGIEGATSVDDLNDLHQDTDASIPEGTYGHYDVVKGGDNWIIEDGAMILRTEYADDSTADNVRYTMAKCVNTKNQMSFKYGYLEIEAEIPFAWGSWPGFWCRPQYEFDAAYIERVGNKLEFDIFEVFGLTKQSYTIFGDTYYYGDPIANVKPQLHKWFNLDGGSSISVQIGDRTTQFTNKTNTFMKGEQGTAFTFGTDLTTARQKHRYGFEWTPEYVAMYVDPDVVNGVPQSEPYWKVNIESENDFWLDGYKKSERMQCFHEEAYVCFSHTVVSSSDTFIQKGNYSDEVDIIAKNKEAFGAPFNNDTIDFKIYSCKLYQRAGETIDYH
ncbi:MAG: family 16 glycosylhydrolase, partial [Acutalibacteraceae bacterium]|nr:family 16 glycosylhydrolase [Acutalibacteraceae bacterium]